METFSTPDRASAGVMTQIQRNTVTLMARLLQPYAAAGRERTPISTSHEARRIVRLFIHFQLHPLLIVVVRTTIACCTPRAPYRTANSLTAPGRCSRHHDCVCVCSFCPHTSFHTQNVSPGERSHCELTVPAAGVLLFTLGVLLHLQVRSALGPTQDPPGTHTQRFVWEPKFYGPNS
jgi:hypothetical protein